MSLHPTDKLRDDSPHAFQFSTHLVSRGTERQCSGDSDAYKQFQEMALEQRTHFLKDLKTDGIYGTKDRFTYCQ